MERRIASPNAFLFGGAKHLHQLQYLEVDIDIELPPSGDLEFDVLRTFHVVDRGTHARTQEVVTQFLADDDVVATAAREEVHTASDLAVGEQRSTRHRVVPIAIDAAKGQDRHKPIRPEVFHRDPRAKRIGQPD